MPAAELAAIRRGWAASVAEREAGVASISAPVRRDGRLLAAVCVSGPASRLGPARAWAALRPWPQPPLSWPPAASPPRPVAASPAAWPQSLPARDQSTHIHRAGSEGLGGVLAQLVDPAVRVRPAAVLDVEQLVAQPHGDRAGLAVADDPLLPGALDDAHRGDHRGRAAGEHLGDLAADAQPVRH